MGKIETVPIFAPPMRSARQNRWRMGRRLAGAALLGVAAWELPYVNWRAAASPLGERPLVIRQDAKGDGRFLSPRSGNRRHRGIDLVADLGSPVHAIRSGRVLEVGTHRGLGRFIVLEHRRHLRSLYAHLKTADVVQGQRVRQGQVIGAVGKTGNARHAWITSHLHLEVMQVKEPINPSALGLVVSEPSGRGTEQAEEDEHSESEARGGG